MPASLRWLALLVAVSLIAAVLAATVLYWQSARKAEVMAATMTGGNLANAPATIGRYGCGACHQIAGIHDAVGTVGPNLNGTATRASIAGRLLNRPDNMIRWLRQPQSGAPGHGMPNQPLNERDARDIAPTCIRWKIKQGCASPGVCLRPGWLPSIRLRYQ